MRRLFIAVSLLLAVGCRIEETPVPSQAPTPQRIEKVETRQLPNVVRVHEQVLSGGLPEGEAAFAELQALGVKTLVSVDGAKPDVELAGRFGLRYVHLPHGYDGIPERRAQELAKAVRDLPGPIYIHCHHGHHRSPAAAAVACVGAGLIASNQAATVLQVGGTSEHYRGLFQSAESARRFDQALLSALPAEFPAIAKLPAMAEAMVAIERAMDHLKTMARANWKTLAAQPDLTPEHEALLLREQFTELLRTSDLPSRPKSFQELLLDAERLAQSLESTLRKEPLDASAASAALNHVKDNCQQCHQRFRDLPARERE